MRTSRASNRPRATGQETATRRDGGTGGYAMIEVVVAMAVVGLVVSLVLPFIAREPGPGALEAKAYEIAALLRDDRNAALNARREVVSQIDLARRIAVAGSQNRAVRVPDSVDIHLLQSGREARAGGDLGGIRFYPDGTASGGVITLYRNGYGFQITVNWATSRVIVERLADGGWVG